jgi:hypothetical protein
MPPKPDSSVLSSDVAEGPKHLRSHPWANHAAIAGLEWRTPAFIHESGAETFKEHDMRQCVLMIMAAAAVTAFASFPAQAQYALCLPARGCIPTTQASYNACLTLARQRGWTDSDNAPRGASLAPSTRSSTSASRAEYRIGLGAGSLELAARAPRDSEKVPLSHGGPFYEQPRSRPGSLSALRRPPVFLVWA